MSFPGSLDSVNQVVRLLKSVIPKHEAICLTWGHSKNMICCCLPKKIKPSFSGLTTWLPSYPTLVYRVYWRGKNAAVCSEICHNFTHRNSVRMIFLHLDATTWRLSWRNVLFACRLGSQPWFCRGHLIAHFGGIKQFYIMSGGNVEGIKSIWGNLDSLIESVGSLLQPCGWSGFTRRVFGLDQAFQRVVWMPDDVPATPHDLILFSMDGVFLLLFYCKISYSPCISSGWVWVKDNLLSGFLREVLDRNRFSQPFAARVTCFWIVCVGKPCRIVKSSWICIGRNWSPSSINEFVDSSNGT